MKKEVKISLIGIYIEIVGVVLDIGHHINIGLKVPEGLISPYHFLIFAGFVITAVGIFMTWLGFNKE